MSAGHQSRPKPQAELTRMMGEGDTPELIAKTVRLDTAHGVGYGGGNSVDGRTVYVDDRLYAELMDGAAYAGASPDDVLRAWIDHEHVEWAIDVGDNPVDSYQAAHSFASAAEDHVYKQSGHDPDRVNGAVAAMLDRCVARYPRRAPRDLWCGPYLDVAFGDDPKDAARAKEIIRAYREQGVIDAFKVSKVEVHYGISDVQCKKCTMYECPGKQISTCSVVSGLVRADRSCDRYQEK